MPLKVQLPLQVVAKLEDISAQLESLHNLLVQQTNFFTLNQRSSSKDIRDRLDMEQVMLSKIPSISEPVHVPSPRIIQTQSPELVNPMIAMQEAPIEMQEAPTIEDVEDMPSENSQDDILEEKSFEELPRKAQELLLGASGMNFRYLSSPSHPFNNRHRNPFKPSREFPKSISNPGADDLPSSASSQKINPRLMFSNNKRFFSKQHLHPWNEDIAMNEHFENNIFA